MRDVVRLRRLRHGIDRIDDAILALAAMRRALVRRVARAKSGAGLPVRDAVRERAVHARAQALARRLRLPPSTAGALLDVLIADACRAQGLGADLGQGAGGGVDGMIAAAMQTDDTDISPSAARWLRLVPPPARLAPVLRRLPPRWRQRALARVLGTALATPIAQGLFEPIAGRRVGIVVTDLGLQWTLELRGGRLAPVDAPMDASVRGTATDLLLLAARLEDADTLFFQRRLVLTGDTELGLTLRNLLDRLPWDAVPLAARIVLHRAAGVARQARRAHRGAQPSSGATA